MDYTIHEICSKIYNLIDDLSYCHEGIPKEASESAQKALKEAVDTLTPYDEGETD